MREVVIRILCTAIAMLAVGAATAPAFAQDAGDPAVEVGDSGPNDPWQGFNRKIFWFNEKLDIYFLRPVAVGWDFIVPELVQTGIRNVFSNVRFPIIFVNDLLQAKPIEATKDLGRFVLNTTVGIGGIWDPAKEIGLFGNNEDFGQTLGYWGVPPGPYLVLPFLGPSNPRDAFGLAADSAAQPYPYFIAWYISAALNATNVVNTRARYIEEIDENRRTALDFYAFQRNAYVSYRENLVNDREEDEEESPAESLYDLDYLDEEPGEDEASDAGADEGGE